MQQALVSELQAALQAKQLATEKAVRCGASRLLSVLSSHGRHLAVSAIGRWVRALALIEADHRESAAPQPHLTCPPLTFLPFGAESGRPTYTYAQP